MRFRMRKIGILWGILLLSVGLWCGCSGSGRLPDWYGADPKGFRFSRESVCGGKISGDRYPEFLAKAAPTGAVLPGLPEYFVPQGIDYWEETGWFLISGYFKPTDYCAHSVLFAVDAGTGAFRCQWDLLNPDGSYHEGHDGGVAVTADNVYLSTSYTLFRISLETLKASGGSGEIRFEEAIPVPVKASFANKSGNYVFVGEFSLEGNPSYTISGHDFQGNHAWCAAYPVDPDSPRGIAEEPEFLISLPERIQGFTLLSDGRLFLTRSYGRTADSTLILTGQSLFETDPAGTAELPGTGGRRVPIYTLGETEEIRAIPMAEGCTAVGNKVYMIFESGAYTYRAENPDNPAKDPTDRIWQFQEAEGK